MQFYIALFNLMNEIFTYPRLLPTAPTNHNRQNMLRAVLVAAPGRRAFSAASMTTLQDPIVLQHLVCPISKYALEYIPEKGVLFCRDIRVAYPIRHGIPILVPMEGRIVPDDEDM
ncbi:Aste57867_8697 [Aphanomyces stellatus]|uniref:Protein preY, mitochondrial n=1 Tax=Aphanomyces stellatus TaxID=120398 RepID=A0A485KL39_9STRA|nr:hypothetical protein As57867_008663 [Aphanomyces stellatus]VFT85583.1 Aste57867_8697 [Aphanomyces stellatus]